MGNTFGVSALIARWFLNGIRIGKLSDAALTMYVESYREDLTREEAYVVAMTQIYVPEAEMWTSNVTRFDMPLAVARGMEIKIGAVKRFAVLERG